MALSLNSILALTIITLCVLLQGGFGLPVSSQPELPAQSPSQKIPHHARVKRCSCSNWLDNECIYFCHLDIIWVNTPNKVIPYGIGSPLSRRRRSTGRCECAHPADKTCSGFCHNSSENPRFIVVGHSDQTLDQTVSSPDTTSNDLLTSLRNMFRSNMAAIEKGSPSRKKNASRVNRLSIG
ncbi:endothelin-2-like [Oncorhynchus tshawytscha]|uniref:Endothelin-like toxin domain-containing protein n=1 Tax=Oncorhynchus tshawytscha TaxID=74940 RepID=A0A8C8JFX3_ONCTS|nr:endothelin-2-like [Oncorhynchus tshawytscha]